MMSNWNDVNMDCVVFGRVSSEVVNSVNKALQMAYPHCLAKHTIDIPFIILIQVETTRSLSLFTFYKRSLDLYTEIPSIEQICNGRLVNIPYTWISATHNAKGIFDIRHGILKCYNNHR